MQNYSKNAKQQQMSAKGLQRQGGKNYNVKLQRNCKVTKKLKTIKKRQNNCKKSDTTKNAAKANNEKKVDKNTKWYKTNTKKKQL